MRYLGIDYGTAHIGLALGDDETRLAIPFQTIESSKEDVWVALETTIFLEGIDAIVVGMPNNPGHDGEQENLTKEFITQLRHRVLCPIYEIDERFTSQEAQKRMHDGGGGDEHAIAAMLILQSYFDNQDRS